MKTCDACNGYAIDLVPSVTWAGFRVLICAKCGPSFWTPRANEAEASSKALGEALEREAAQGVRADVEIPIVIGKPGEGTGDFISPDGTRYEVRGFGGGGGGGGCAAVKTLFATTAEFTVPNPVPWGEPNPYTEAEKRADDEVARAFWLADPLVVDLLKLRSEVDPDHLDCPCSGCDVTSGELLVRYDRAAEIAWDRDEGGHRSRWVAIVERTFGGER